MIYSCDLENCGNKAEYQLVILIRPINMSDDRELVRMIVDSYYCESHRWSMIQEDYVCKDFLDSIDKTLKAQRLPIIDREKVQTDFIPIKARVVLRGFKGPRPWIK